MAQGSKAGKRSAGALARAGARASARAEKPASAAPAKKKVASKPRKTARKSGAAPQRPLSAEELESECATLRSKLAEAEMEIARLKRRQDLVVNRIDWVIDSLHNLLDEEG